MNAEWYYQSSTGEQSGPVTAQKLKQLAALGLIVAATPIRKGEAGRWVTADKVKGLLGPTPRPVEPLVDDVAAPAK